MIRQFHAWVHAQKNWKQMCKQKLGHEYVRRHHPQTPRGGGDSTVRQQRMDERTAVHPYSRKWFKYEKEWSTDTCCGEDEPQKHYSKQKKLGPKGQCTTPVTQTTQRQITAGCCQGLGEGGMGVMLERMGFLSRRWSCSGTEQRCWLHNIVTIKRHWTVHF